MIETPQIVAIAARTPVGLAAESSAAAIRAGVSRLTLQPASRDSRNEPIRAARDARLDPALLGAFRVEQLASLALAELLGKLGSSSHEAVLGVAFAEPRPGVAPDHAETTLRALQRRAQLTLPMLRTMALPAGHAGALAGIAQAARAIAEGSPALFLIGGVDSYFAEGTLQWLEQEGRLRISGRAGGFAPGEAAGFVALASEATRRALDLPSLARVLGAAEALEARGFDDDVGPLGEGIARAVRAASRCLELPAQRIGDIYLDLNGERMRNDDWSCAALRAPELFEDATAYTTGVAECGDVGAASGALSAVLAVEGLRRAARTARPSLVCGSSWTGLRAACLLAPGTEVH
jgi:3-oxoacyl-[acyl-carrier-protein] synthase I